MKLLFLSDNFPPEVNAPATRTFEHCRYWAKRGIDVTVITCNPNFPQGKIYDGYKNKLYQKEIIDGITVIRVWSFMAPNVGMFKRVFDFLSYAIMAFIVGLFQKTDLIIATSPQLFTAVAGRWLSFFKRKPWIMEVRDMWPESIKSVGVNTGGRWIFKRLEILEKSLYRAADEIVVVTDSFKEIIAKKGIRARKIDVIKNGVMLNNFLPMPKDTGLIKELNLEGKFIVGYLGTHGMAHALDFIVKSASKIEDKKIHLLLIGDGAKKDELLKLKADLNVNNITFLPFQAKSDINRYISILDVALVNLKKSEVFKSVIPSKIFENAAMQKPILLGVEGESKKIIDSYGAGVSFEPENEEDFLLKLKMISENPERFKEYQKNCAKLAKDFDRNYLAEKMLAYIKEFSRLPQPVKRPQPVVVAEAVSAVDYSKIERGRKHLRTKVFKKKEAV